MWFYLHQRINYSSSYITFKILAHCKENRREIGSIFKKKKAKKRTTISIKKKGSQENTTKTEWQKKNTILQRAWRNAIRTFKNSLKEKSTYQGSRYHIFELFDFFGHK